MPDEDLTPTPMWRIGNNVPGHPPDTNPRAVGEFNTACVMLAEQLEARGHRPEADAVRQRTAQPASDFWLAIDARTYWIVHR